MMIVKRLQYGIEYLFVKAVAFFVSLFPWRCNRKLAVGLLPLFSLLGYKRLTIDNIKKAHLDLPKEGSPLKAFVREVFIQNILTYIEMIHLMTMGKEDVLKVITIENEEVLKRIYTEYPGVIFVLGHLGNWELMGQVVAYKGYPLAVIARKQNNPLTDRLVNRMREKSGVRIIYRDRRAVPETLRLLREGYGVAILNDQDGGIAGVTTTFMGRRCSTPHGPVIFALKTGCPVSFVTVRRLEDGTSVGHIGEPFLLTRQHEDLDDDIRFHLQGLVDRLEEAVKENPAQWNWLANRWRTQRK
ncbi:MAG TPA: lysophospholipid acyltransferase family protein [Candidatus Mcinerneyibacteriales bacterium]|nr:lysophospholipid acyltransferase family protein [Candidatus Mcinerneyibacteriales bacterium]